MALAPLDLRWSVSPWRTVTSATSVADRLLGRHSLRSRRRRRERPGDRHAHRSDRNVDNGVVRRVDHSLLRLDGFVLDIHAAQLATNNLHRVGDTLRLDLALGALLPLDFDLGVLALQFLRRCQLARDRISHFSGILHVADDHARDRERAVTRVGSNSREHRIADRDQRVFDLEAVALLNLVAREGPQRFANEVAVRDLDNLIWLALVT